MMLGQEELLQCIANFCDLHGACIAGFSLARLENGKGCIFELRTALHG